MDSLDSVIMDSLDSAAANLENHMPKFKSYSVLGDEKPAAESLELMRNASKQYRDVRWAAYQNHALDSANCGHLQFLAVGPENTCKQPPPQYPADTAAGLGWRYLWVGWVNLELECIEPGEVE